MATVNKTVRKSILCYPSLWSNRSEVLHYILCVIGTGWEWGKKGEPVYPFSKDFKPWVPEEKAPEVPMDEGDTFAKFRAERNEEFRVNQNKINQDRVDNVDTVMHVIAPIKEFYPQSKYALVMTMPDNVTDEWREACENIKEEARLNGWVF